MTEFDAALTAQALATELSKAGISQSRLQPWPSPAPAFADGLVMVGPGQPAVEVAVLPQRSAAPRALMRGIWQARQAGRPNPVVLVAVGATHNDSSVLWVGPDAASLDVLELDWTTARALIVGAAEQAAGPAAVRYLIERLPRDGEEGIPGINNLGMFAAHALIERARDFPEWDSAAPISTPLRAKSGRALVEALGYTVEQTGQVTEVLRGEDDRATAIAVFLDQGEAPDASAARFGGQTPVGAALARAERDNIPFVLITRGSSIRLHVTGRLHGVGRKGPAETLIQADMSLLRDEHLPYVPLIFGAKALADGGSFERLLSLSRDYSAALSTRLRERIYTDVVPKLAIGLANARGQGVDLDDIYEETLVLLFRLLFVAYAEDRDLLPYRSNKRYRDASLKAMARSLSDIVEEGRSFENDETDGLWQDCFQLFSAVDKGSPTWDVPAYNGGLFSGDEPVNKAGGALASVTLPNNVLGPALTFLLTEPGMEDGIAGPVDFRSLSVRDFGTIYEGLLESGISEATEDLALDARGNYVPAGAQDPVVRAGDIYHHNRGGARKSTGSYFTKDFAVEHLLDKALLPAVDVHLERVRALVESGDATAAAEAFFDFRCADIAMGSGHFLVAAVDKIEERFSRFLDQHAVLGVLSELDRLRDAARRGLGDSADLYEIERRALLRRQIARRCIYGVDANRIAVELAQLALWVHTFVPGLALTYLGHNLVHGNSLTGIGTIEEAAAALDDPGMTGNVSIFSLLIQDLLARSVGPLRRLARANDATRADMKEVYEAQAEATNASEPARMLFDLLCAQRRGETNMVELAVDEAAITGHVGLAGAEQRSSELAALHLPIAFPEVFLRSNPGFDCILGNPPWEEATVERLKFWTLRFPGLKSMTQARQLTRVAQLESQRPDLVAEYEGEVALQAEVRAALAAGPFPGMGVGDPDLYKAFAWRFWGLLREGGHAGVVLPRSALFAAGSADWRDAIFERRGWKRITTLLNSRQWVFEDVHPQYTFGLVVLAKEPDRRDMTLVGPFRSLEEMAAEADRSARAFPVSEVRSWVPGAGLPLFATKDSPRVFERYVTHPRLGAEDRPDGWRVRPHREFDATNDKKFMVMEEEPPSDMHWPVYKGASFELWNNDTGVRYAWAEPDVVRFELQRRRQSSSRNRRSVFAEMPPDWVRDPKTLPCLHPRIVFRDITRSTDTRTVICALVPGNLVVTNKAPYLLFPRGDEHDQAYVLGVLSSMPLDWYARRIIELGLSFHAFNGFPVPAPSHDNPSRREVICLAASLARLGRGLSDWAPGIAGVDVSARDDVLARLDALVAGLYGLERDDVIHIFETFHEGWDHRERLDRVLAHYESL